MEKSRFSEKIHEDIIKSLPKNSDECQYELASALLCARVTSHSTGKISSGMKSFSSAVADYLRHLMVCIRIEMPTDDRDNDWSRIFTEGRNRDSMNQHAFSSESLRAWINALPDLTSMDRADELASDVSARRAALRGAFLISGYAGDPISEYRIEIRVADSTYVEPLMMFFHGQNIIPNIARRGNTTILYLRDGEQIADFLAFIGAHRSVVFYESIRAEKEVRSQVNRVVNCDTANAMRQAEAGMKRAEKIRRIIESSNGSDIPQELLDTARVFLDNPGLSIRDIGELMDPPIGKSGMHHRLKKLEQMADEGSLSNSVKEGV